MKDPESMQVGATKPEIRLREAVTLYRIRASSSLGTSPKVECRKSPAAQAEAAPSSLSFIVSRLFAICEDVESEVAHNRRNDHGIMGLLKCDVIPRKHDATVNRRTENAVSVPQYSRKYKSFTSWDVPRRTIQLPCVPPGIDGAVDRAKC